jgi:crotonobetainyl-CoA:carnitine CoA-transferase CaiB-like acyl-CoA transferase
MTERLARLKVIDCASRIAEPTAATILADFGADVIKIEPPGAGDPWRASAPIPVSSPFHLDATRGGAVARGPSVGQHSEEVLDEAGYST